MSPQYGIQLQRAESEREEMLRRRAGEDAAAGDQRCAQNSGKLYPGLKNQWQQARAVESTGYQSLLMR